MVSPAMRRQVAEKVQQELAVPERRVCRVLGQRRSTQRYNKHIPGDEDVLTARIVALASQYDRYGYRRIGVYLVMPV